LDGGFSGWTDSGGVAGRAEIENELGSGEEEPDVGLVVVEVFALRIFITAIVGGGGEISLGMDSG